MRLQAAGVSLSDYFARLGDDGGIVEERIVGRPAAQPERAAGTGDGHGAGIVGSTHDQILDGGRPGLRSAAASRPSPPSRELTDRRAPRSASCWPRPAPWAAPRSTSSSRATRRRRLVRVAIGAEPAQGRHDASAGGPGAAERGRVRPRVGDVPRPVRLAAPLRRDGPPGVAAAEGARPQRPSEHGPRLALDGCGVVFHMLSSLDELGRVG